MIIVSPPPQHRYDNCMWVYRGSAIFACARYRYWWLLLLLLLGSPSNTLLECRSNQRICPKTDSHVPKCGVPWLPLIESGDEPNSPGKSQGHCGRIPQIPWVAHSSISSFRSQLRTFLKDMINRLLPLPTPSASRVNLWAETTLIWAEGQMMPTSHASKMHSFLSMQVCIIWIHRLRDSFC